MGGTPAKSIMESENLSDNKIHVVLAVYDPRGTYSRHAGVVMVSMFSNTKSPICVHILHDETLNEDNRSKFIELTEKFGQQINFIDAGEHIGKFCVDVDKLTHRYSRGSLFRLFIQDLLPVDKVIYLDCDVAVQLDIKELWDIELDDCEIGAVLEDIARNPGDNSQKKLFFCKYAGIEAEKYFNSGVILFNLKKIKENNVNVFALALEFFRRYPYSSFPDQDFMNKMFQKNMREIDRKFNYFGSGIDYSNVNGKLWHFVEFEGKKPWELAQNPIIDALYWRYFAMTPWSRDLAADMTEAWAGSRFIHVHSSDCFRTLRRKLKEHFSPRSMTPLFKIAVIWHDLIYRIRKKFGV